MNKRVVGWMVGAGLLFLLLPGGVRPAEKMARQYRINLDQDVCLAMNRAADFLVRSQKPGKPGMPGWSWVVDRGPSASNVSGLAALGLLEAHQLTGERAYRESAEKYARGLLARRDQLGSRRLPYKADIELLAGLSGEYQDAARELFALIRQRSPTGAREVNRIAVGRRATPALLGFDVALGIRAALALGERRYALEMADEVIRRLPAWYDLKADRRFSLISAGALSDALERLDSGHYAGSIDRFRRDLVRTQAENGSWLQNETQVSAYAASALLDSNKNRERRAAEAAIHWLKSTMLKQGSFAAYNDYMPEPFVGQVISEVNAEALLSLTKACALN